MLNSNQAIMIKQTQHNKNLIDLTQNQPAKLQRTQNLHHIKQFQSVLNSNQSDKNTQSQMELPTTEAQNSPSGPRLDRFFMSFKIDKPCFSTFSERRTLSFLTRQRYSQAPPPPLSTWFSSLFNWVSSVLLTIFANSTSKASCFSL